LDSFSKNYEEYLQSEKELKKIEEDEKKIIDLKEFASFEISKIEEINPKVDEYEMLLTQKKELSKKEKIENAINEASLIFEYETKVNEALTLLEYESNFFDESFNELRVVFEDASYRLSQLGDLDIEQMLDRLEKLSSLKNKHGTIENSLLYLDEKRKELAGYENIEFEKSELIKKVEELKIKVDKNALFMSKKREDALKILSQRTEHYLNLLYLENITYSINKAALHPLGYDDISVTLKQTALEKVSGGELNRIRLAQLASASEFIYQNGGVLILDEIDANLSGKESMSIAKVLELLSKTYQIFAISHQPQLSSKAQMHFLVYKEDGESRVKILKKDERVAELSRMISGDKVSLEATEFAKSLLSS
jgi:DNA repair protein RecN (Recombination protein N)